MMPLEKVIREVEEKMKKTLEAAAREFLAVRTGRASPSLVEGLMVEYYGGHTPLKQLASITIPDARLIVIQPWDKTVLDAVEKAIQKSSLGINPNNDGKVVRLAIPALSQERRQELAKVVKGMAEDARVSIRTIRRDAKVAIDELEKSKKISEDDKFKGFEKLQKITDDYIKKVDRLLEDKQKELTEF